ncbi:hypothetical protein RFI_20876, partial [Reticulomyxa filosa]
ENDSEPECVDGTCLFACNQMNRKVFEWLTETGTETDAETQSQSVSKVNDTNKRRPSNEYNVCDIPMVLVWRSPVLSSTRFIIRLTKEKIHWNWKTTKQYLMQQLKINAACADIMLDRLSWNREQSEHIFELQLFETSITHFRYVHLKFSTWCDLRQKSSPFIDYPRLVRIDWKGDATEVYHILRDVVADTVFGICVPLHSLMREYLVDTDRLSIRFLVVNFEQNHLNTHIHIKSIHLKHQPWEWKQLGVDLIKQMQSEKTQIKKNFNSPWATLCVLFDETMLEIYRKAITEKDKFLGTNNIIFTP